MLTALLFAFWLFCTSFVLLGSTKHIRILRAYDRITRKGSVSEHKVRWDAFHLPPKSARMSDYYILLRAATTGTLRFALFIMSLISMLVLIMILPRPFSHVISHYMSKVTLYFLGLKLVVTGSINAARSTPIIVANHVGMIDVFILLSIGRMSFVADNAIRRFFVIGRIWGYLAERIDCLFLSRSCTSSRQALRDALGARCVDIKKGLKPHLAIFPEGTTSNGSGILNFKYGAFEGMQQVQPVTLNYSNKEWGYCSVWSDVYFAYIMNLPPSTVDVNILPPQSPQAHDNAETFGKRVRDLMIKKSGLIDYANIPNPSRTHNHICNILNRHT